MSNDEPDLVQRCLSGDAPSMREFVERFQGMIYQLCYRMLGHRQDAEDIAQEVFLRAFKSLHRWDSNRTLRPWLLTIAANRCKTFYEQKSRKPIPTELAYLQEDTSLVPDHDLAEELQLALNTLRDDYRTCFTLFYQQDLNCAEIGEIMDRPQGTIKTWLHRARNELSEYLKRRGVTPDGKHELFNL